MKRKLDGIEEWNDLRKIKRGMRKMMRNDGNMMLKIMD